MESRLLKSLFTILILLSITPNSKAQSSIHHEAIGFFELSHIGQDFTFSYKANIKRHSFLAGIRYHQNTIIKDDQSYIFKNRFYARNFRERIGINLGYHYNFRLRFSSIKPFFFYNFQAARMGIKQIYPPYSSRLSFQSDPMNSFDQVLGVGFGARIYKSLHFYGQAGLGVVIFSDLDRRILMSDPTWEFSSKFSFGLGWEFGSY